MPSFNKGASSRANDSSARKAGSRSPKHRGFRPDETPAKRRWTADDRAARGGSTDAGRRGDRTPASTDGRPDWTPRGKSGWVKDERPARRPFGERDERPRRTSDERPRRDSGDSRPRREGDDRPRRDFSDRPRRDFDADRPRRDFSDRPRRDADERPRRDSGDSRPRREGDDRPRRDFSDRPRRDFDADRPRRDFSDRPRRDADERPRRESSDERPRREYNDRPRRDFDADRPRRDFSDRPRRDAGADRPRRDFSDRPRRDADERPARRDSEFYPDRAERTFTPQDDVVLERLEAQAIQATDTEGVSFGDLGLGGNIVRALAELGADSPFPIQAATIPDVLSGRDVLGRGRTGSGKTIAFGAPLVERLMEDGGGKRRAMGRKPRALIMAPTRELALQIDRTVQPIARAVGLFTTQVYGGVPQAKQVGALRRGVDIVIGTPGRIEDLERQGHLDLSEVVVTVLDEADHMCDLGFLEPVQRILRMTSDGGQKLLFSATLDSGVAALVEEFLVEPSVHEVAGENQESSTIEHRVLLIDHRDKTAILEELSRGDSRKLVFTRTRAFAEQVAEGLEDVDIPAVSLHGDLNQSRRTRNLEKLTNGRVNILVATDVAARGIHVDDISLVIQADAPDEYKTYMHRSGRTGRAGKDGIVVTLVARNRRRRMEELLSRAEIEAEWTQVRPGDEIIAELAGA